jgi:hypothetical protein
MDCPEPPLNTHSMGCAAIAGAGAATSASAPRETKRAAIVEPEASSSARAFARDALAADGARGLEPTARANARGVQVRRGGEDHGVRHRRRTHGVWP